MSEPPADDLRREVARVKARLARERAARRESEDIAEATLRRLYQGQQEADLISRVTSIANSASEVGPALRDAMDLIRTSASWQVGHYFLPATDNPTVMVSAGEWSGEVGDPFLEELRTATRGMRFPPGVGMPGTAFVDGATWEQSIQDSANFPRQESIRGGAAFAFPILIGNEVVAVMEFLQPAPRPEEPGLLALAEVVGIQLGRVVERSRSQRREISHRTALQEAVEERTSDLISARNRAEAQSQARATLFSTVSHDLQTPLHAAISELRSVSDGEDPVDSARRGSLHLAELQQRIQALVDLAGTTSKAVVDRPHVVALGRILQDVVNAHSATIGRTGPAPDVSIATSAAHPVLVDVDRFQRIVHTVLAGHLIDDAAGSVRLRLEVRSAWAELTVEEPTPGPDSATFALTTQLAEACGGSARETPLPEGRRHLDISIPVAVQGRVRRGAGRRVLLVDDIAVTRRISAAMLARLGADVTTAENGQQSLAALRAGDFALVLMDLRMPVMGGLEAARRIRAGEAGGSASDVPIVALTAHAAAGDSDQSLLAGMDAHMTKPFTLADLRVTTERYAPELATAPSSPG